MSYDAYVDGEQVGPLATYLGWDEAATWIEHHAPKDSPLQTLAATGATDKPQECAAELRELLKGQLDIDKDNLHTLTILQGMLTGKFFNISDGVGIADDE